MLSASVLRCEGAYVRAALIKCAMLVSRQNSLIYLLGSNREQLLYLLEKKP